MNALILRTFLVSLLPASLSAGALLFFNILKPRKALVASLLFSALLCVGSYLIPPDTTASSSFDYSLLANFIGTAAVLYFLHKTEKNRIIPWKERLDHFQDLEDQEEKKRVNSKQESDDLEKETVRTVRVYGVVKGLGEALSWGEMLPHIDYAVQNCMAFRDYQLYLIDDNSEFQKVLSRGARMMDAPIQKPSSLPQWHAKNNELYLEIPIRRGEIQIALLWMRVSPFMEQIPKETILNETSELAEELVMGLEKARLFSSLEKLSRYDGLTGVHRRQIFTDRLNEEIRRARAFRTSFSVLICDLDHFKNVNDTYGHQGGDEVLKRVGKILKESIYETDFVARYGGEEFVVLFPQADPFGVQRKAEVIRKRIEEEKFIFGWNTISITISIGIAHYPANGTDPATLLSVADKALYVAKESGRNRVVDSSQIW